MEEQGKLLQHVVMMIRERSRDGQLVSTREALQEFKNQGSKTGGKEIVEADLQALLPVMMETYKDLKTIGNPEGHLRYYSSLHMSETYAKILIRKEGDPLLLIANTVRETTATCSRPIPVSQFLSPPFTISPEEMDACLLRMGEDSQYQDIHHTTTSIGTRFLYSTRSLTSDRASMLAEWIDVGQHGNP